MSSEESLVPTERIERSILVLRGQRVVLDSDLAAVFSVETKFLNRAVKRNLGRFPADFVFQLTLEEMARLRCQCGTSNVGRGGRRYIPYAFTEHGTVMAAMVLNSPRAVEASVFVVRAFVKMHEFVSGNAELARRLDELERRLGKHDIAIRELIDAIKRLTALPLPPDAPPQPQTGFRVKERATSYRTRRRSKPRSSGQ